MTLKTFNTAIFMGLMIKGDERAEIHILPECCFTLTIGMTDLTIPFIFTFNLFMAFGTRVMPFECHKPCVAADSMTFCACDIILGMNFVVHL